MTARRHDPQRRDRIVDACLDVIAEVGVAGTTHRRVALAADVPLGSMSYHFSGMDELLRAAFERFSSGASERFEERLSVATSAAEARETLVDVMLNDVFTTRSDLVLTHELYTLAARDEGYRTITEAWMQRSRAVLEEHFDPATARILDALMEGLTIHRALSTAPFDERVVAAAVERVARER